MESKSISVDRHIALCCRQPSWPSFLKKKWNSVHLHYYWSLFKTDAASLYFKDFNNMCCRDLLWHLDSPLWKYVLLAIQQWSAMFSSSCSRNCASISREIILLWRQAIHSKMIQSGAIKSCRRPAALTYLRLSKELICPATDLCIRHANQLVSKDYTVPSCSVTITTIDIDWGAPGKPTVCLLAWHTIWAFWLHLMACLKASTKIVDKSASVDQSRYKRCFDKNVPVLPTFEARQFVNSNKPSRGVLVSEVMKVVAVSYNKLIPSVSSPHEVVTVHLDTLTILEESIKRKISIDCVGPALGINIGNHVNAIKDDNREDQHPTWYRKMPEMYNIEYVVDRITREEIQGGVIK